MGSLISTWVRDIPQSGIRVIFHEAIKYRDVIHLEIGDPDFRTPTALIDEAYKALLDGYTHYTHNKGLYELREAISEYYRKRYGARFDPENNIVITLGSTEGLFLTLLAVLNPGDEVLIPDPGYPSYVAMIKAARGRVKRYRLREENDFKYSLLDIKSEVTSRTKAIIINNPCNPTGSVTPLNGLLEIIKFANENNILILSDEVYERIVFDEEFHSLAELSSKYSNVVVVNSLSKTFAMTGWRVGFVLTTDEKLAETLTRLQEGVAACAPSAFQKAAIKALKSLDDEVIKMVKEYKKRRDILLKLLRDIPGVKFVTPKATFYLFLNISKYTENSLEFSLKLLRQKKVAVAPGISFGRYGEGHIRISYAASINDIINGINRLKEFLNEFKR